MTFLLHRIVTGGYKKVLKNRRKYYQGRRRVRERVKGETEAEVLFHYSIIAYSMVYQHRLEKLYCSYWSTKKIQNGFL